MTPRTVQFDPTGHLQWAEKIAEPIITMGMRETATMIAVSRVNALILTTAVGGFHVVCDDPGNAHHHLPTVRG